MKKTVIYHSADFDGIFCREIARHFLGDKDVNYIGWNFGDPIIEVPKEDVVYVMDLPLDAPLGIVPAHSYPVFDKVPKIVWIDHHASSIASHAKDIPGYRIDGVAACRLAWQWFSACRRADAHQSGPESKKWAIEHFPWPLRQDFVDCKVYEPVAVRLAGEYDVWDKRDPDAETFQYALRATDLTAYWPGLLDLSMDSELTNCQASQAVVYSIMPSGRAAQRYAQTVDAGNMKASFLTQWEGLNFLCLNGRGNSITFASRDMPETGHDALMMFFFNGKKWIFSLYHARHRTDLDLSAIAVRHGGGGHKGACGFTTDHFLF